MEAIYVGNATWHGVNTGAGAGPWVGADLEAGMYYGGGNVTENNTQSTPLAFEYVTASLKGRSDGFTLKGGDATAGPLKLMYDGPRPYDRPGPAPKGGSYQPMRKQGAIILATGGDSSARARGTFYVSAQCLLARMNSRARLLPDAFLVAALGAATPRRRASWPSATRRTRRTTPCRRTSSPSATAAPPPREAAARGEVRERASERASERPRRRHRR